MPDNCNPDNCPVGARVEGLEKEFNRYRDEANGIHQKLDERIGALEQSGAAVGAKLDSIDDKLDKLVEWQEAQMGRPGKRWDGLVDKAIWAVCAAVIAFLLGRVGL